MSWRTCGGTPGANYNTGQAPSGTGNAPEQWTFQCTQDFAFSNTRKLLRERRTGPQRRASVWWQKPDLTCACDDYGVMSFQNPGRPTPPDRVRRIIVPDRSQCGRQGQGLPRGVGAAQRYARSQRTLRDIAALHRPCTCLHIVDAQP